MVRRASEVSGGSWIRRFAEAPVEAPVGTWALDAMPGPDRTALSGTFGTMFAGALEPTVAYVLDQWATRGHGVAIQLVSTPDGPCDEGRAPAILDRCFVATRTACRRLACRDFAGDLEAAVQAALAQHMQALGLGPGVEPAP